MQGDAKKLEIHADCPPLQELKKLRFAVALALSRSNLALVLLRLPSCFLQPFPPFQSKTALQPGVDSVAFLCNKVWGEHEGERAHQTGKCFFGNTTLKPQPLPEVHPNKAWLCHSYSCQASMFALLTMNLDLHLLSVCVCEQTSPSYCLPSQGSSRIPRAWLDIV